MQLRVAGQAYRVVTTAPDSELKELVGILEQRLAGVNPAGRLVAPQAILLAALGLVHDLEDERARRVRVETQAKETLARVLERIDAALVEEEDPAGAPPPAAPGSRA